MNQADAVKFLEGVKEFAARAHPDFFLRDPDVDGPVTLEAENEATLLVAVDPAREVNVEIAYAISSLLNQLAQAGEIQ